MVHISFDDGDHWQSLRLNMPCTSIRDLVIKDNDLVVATHGRSFWILDDINALREINKETSAQPAILYTPEDAYRVRWSMNTDTPMPQEEPLGENPPDGAVIDYYLKEKSNTDISLDILDSTGRTVRHYSSSDKADSVPDVNIPLYWIRPFRALSGEAGSHRFEWDMHEQSIPNPASFPMSAVFEETAPSPTSPWVMPGLYTARLTVNGKSLSKNFRVLLDPRVKSGWNAFKKQYDLSEICYRDLRQIHALLQETIPLRIRLDGQASKASAGDFLHYLNQLTLPPVKQNKENLLSLQNTLQDLMNKLQEADMEPTLSCSEAVHQTHQLFEKCTVLFEALKKEILQKF
jgi:hypothetical protein